MSKLDIGVGDEFPLDESGEPQGRRGRHRGHHHHGHHGHHHFHHHHRGAHGLGRLATLLLVAGLAALIVEHKLPAEAAYGLVALGAAGLVITVALHRRHHRQSQQVS
jgi:hypothetical protein